jgi:hypothetical protein
MVQKLRSFAEGFGDPTTRTSTPKSMEEITTKVMIRQLNYFKPW